MCYHAWWQKSGDDFLMASFKLANLTVVMPKGSAILVIVCLAWKRLYVLLELAAAAVGPPPMVLLSPIKTWPQYYCICRRRRFRGGGQMKWDTCQREGTKVTFLRPFNYCIATLGYNHLLRTVSIFAFPQALLLKMMMVGMNWIGHYVVTPLIGKPHIFE